MCMHIHRSEKSWFWSQAEVEVEPLPHPILVRLPLLMLYLCLGDQNLLYVISLQLSDVVGQCSEQLGESFLLSFLQIVKLLSLAAHAQVEPLWVSPSNEYLNVNRIFPPKFFLLIPSPHKLCAQLPLVG